MARYLSKAMTTNVNKLTLMLRCWKKKLGWHLVILKKHYSPTPGIEPGPPGWKPGILAIRPRGIDEDLTEKTRNLKHILMLSQFSARVYKNYFHFSRMLPNKLSLKMYSYIFPQTKTLHQWNPVIFEILT